MAGQQQEEIETIRSRTIEVKLSDADVKRISEKAAAHGLTVGELIENFIGDLVCGTYSNGSDERMYAEQWFERCWFGMFPDLTFLRYLIEWGGLDEVIGAWENIKSTEENIQTSEEALASGVMKGRGGRTYGRYFHYFVVCLLCFMPIKFSSKYHSYGKKRPQIQLFRASFA